MRVEKKLLEIAGVSWRTKLQKIPSSVIEKQDAMIERVALAGEGATFSTEMWFLVLRCAHFIRDLSAEDETVNSLFRTVELYRAIGSEEYVTALKHIAEAGQDQTGSGLWSLESVKSYAKSILEGGVPRPFGDSQLEVLTIFIGELKKGWLEEAGAEEVDGRNTNQRDAERILSFLNGREL